MKKNIIKNKITLNNVFSLWLTLEILFSYTLVSQISLFIFCAIVFYLNPKIPKSGYLVSIILFTVFSFINIITKHAVSESVAFAMTKTMFFNCLFMWCFLLYVNYISNVFIILNVIKNVLFFCSIISVTFGINSLIAGNRLKFLGLNPNDLAILCAFTCIVSFYKLFNSKNANVRIKQIVIIFLFFLTIILSGSRTGIIIILCGIYVLICFSNPKKIFIYTLFVILFTIGSYYILTSIKFLNEIVGHRLNPVLLYFKGLEVGDSSIISRTNYIILAWKESQGSLFWGHGLDCFRLLPQSYGTYSHNNYLEILYSLGFVGLIVYYYPHAITILKLPIIIIKKKLNKIDVLMISMIIPYLIAEAFSVSYFTRSKLIIPAMFLLHFKKNIIIPLKSKSKISCKI